MNAVRVSRVVEEWLAQIAAQANPVLARAVSSTVAEVVVLMMVVAAAAAQPRARAQAPVPAPVELVGCTAEHLDPVRSTCWKQRGPTASREQNWLSSWRSVRTSVILSTP